MYCWTVDDFQEQPYAASDTNLAAFTRRACPPFSRWRAFAAPLTPASSTWRVPFRQGRIHLFGRHAVATVVADRAFAATPASPASR